METPERFTLVPEGTPGRPAAQRRPGLRAPRQRARREATPFEPDFAHAVTRHKLIEAIERSSAEGKSVRL